MNSINIPGLARILVVNDDLAANERLRSLLVAQGAVVECARDPAAARDAVAARRFNVIFLAHAIDPSWALLPVLGGHAAVILLAAADTEIGVVDAMRAGALDVAPVDATDDRILATVRRCLDERFTRLEAEHLGERLRELAPSELVGLSTPMRAVMLRIDQYAMLPDAPVLITGGAGTGKELAARCVHARSARRHGPFLAVNCAAFPGAQLEAELFGCEAGALPGVTGMGSTGRLIEAAGGTIYLDAIDTMETALQAKLLRALHERVVRRIGGSRDLFTDVRIVAAACGELDEAVQARTFRDDLFLGLSARRLHLPSLVERASDIPLLAHFFLSRFSRQMGKALLGFTEEAMETICEYEWPGNVRELKNAIERAALAADSGPIDEVHLPMFSGGRLDGRDVISSGQVSLEVRDRSLRCVEGQLVERVLSETSWNISRAAAILGINRTTLYNKIKLHKLARQTHPSV